MFKMTQHSFPTQVFGILAEKLGGDNCVGQRIGELPCVEMCSMRSTASSGSSFIVSRGGRDRALFGNELETFASATCRKPVDASVCNLQQHARMYLFPGLTMCQRYNA